MTCNEYGSDCNHKAECPECDRCSQHCRCHDVCPHGFAWQDFCNRCDEPSTEIEE